MPFSTDTTWPAGLLKIFELCRKDQIFGEKRYYGPYTTLLSYCFGPSSFEFFVAPQAPPGESYPHDSIEDIVFLVVFNDQNRPVLFAEIKDDGWVTKASGRFEADELIRRRYDDMIWTCPLPRLWALSLLGTSLRVYRGDVATLNIDPEFEDRPDRRRVLPKNFLEGAWNMDILSQEGFAKMKEIVNDITGGATAL